MSELDLAELTAASLERIRERTPLIHNITNYVVMNDTANVLLASGASPVMAHAIRKSARWSRYAGALVLNIGTLDDDWVESMLIAGQEANARGVPIVLDPVGAGATGYRTDDGRADLVDRPGRRSSAAMPASWRRSRASEGRSGASTPSPPTLRTRPPGWSPTGRAARPWPAAPSTTWPTQRAVADVQNGHPLMGRITGSGCMATAMVGAFLAVEQDPFLAASRP